LKRMPEEPGINVMISLITWPPKSAKVLAIFNQNTAFDAHKKS
jgi:hypothetical protein